MVKLMLLWNKVYNLKCFSYLQWYWTKSAPTEIVFIRKIISLFYAILFIFGLLLILNYVSPPDYIIRLFTLCRIIWTVLGYLAFVSFVFWILLRIHLFVGIHLMMFVCSFLLRFCFLRFGEGCLLSLMVLN